MSEQRESYHYTADKESAPQQHHSTSGAFAIVRPHLEVEAEALSRSTPDFLARLTAFLTNPDDPTGLKLDNLRQQASSLSRSFTTISSLLAQLADLQEETS